MSRWLQAPLYIGLIVAQGIYVWQFWKELIHLISMMSFDKTVTETELMLIVLGLIDVVMISNLLVMVIVGGWETFVSRMQLEDHPDQPEWLSHVNAGVLKVKLATAINGIQLGEVEGRRISQGDTGLTAAGIGGGLSGQPRLAPLHLRAHRVEVHEPRLEERFCYRL
jgi:hypothetical protein